VGRGPKYRKAYKLETRCFLFIRRLRFFKGRNRSSIIQTRFFFFRRSDPNPIKVASWRLRCAGGFVSLSSSFSFDGTFLALSWFWGFDSWIFINPIQLVRVGNFVVRISILSFLLIQSSALTSLIYYMIYAAKFWNYYDASMTQKELMDIICPVNVASEHYALIPKMWYWYEFLYINKCLDDRKELMDIICPVNVASVWMPRCLECDIDMNFYSFIMPRWPKRNFWMCFKEDETHSLLDYFCSLNFVNVGMLRWFYDLECKSRLWIVTNIWYMSLNFDTIVMPQ